jgi:uncharacterized membrane protein YphA (DoxX/SURF4 family)
MSNDGLLGVVFIIAGLFQIVFYDDLGRYHAKPFKANPKPFQKVAFFVGLLFILIGILTLIFS